MCNYFFFFFWMFLFLSFLTHLSTDICNIYKQKIISSAFYQMYNLFSMPA